MNMKIKNNGKFTKKLRLLMKFSFKFSWKNKWIIIVGLIITLFLLLPLISYKINFWSYSISKNPNDWGTFGSYISGVYAFINVLTLLMLTYIANNINKNVANTQLKQSIYNAYFEQINQLFFNVVKNYTEYYNDRSGDTASKLTNSLELYKIFVTNISLETEAINNVYNIDKTIKNNAKTCKSFIDKFSTCSNEEMRDLLRKFIKNKTNLINNINKNLKLK